MTSTETSARSPLSTGVGIRVALASASFCLLLCSYYLIRPIRDNIGVLAGQENLKWLFSATFLCTLAVVPLFGWLAKKCPRWLLTPCVYLIVILILTGFGIAFHSGTNKVLGTAFFIWISFFNLMVVSLFWSTVSDTFSTEQAKSCYGYIAAGGTAGAVIGPGIAVQLAREVSTSALLYLSAGLLSLAMIFLILIRSFSPKVDASGAVVRPIGGSIFSGITQTLRVPVLRNLAGLVICYTAISTIVYIEMNGLVRVAYPDDGLRKQFFARMDLIVNVTSLIIQLLLTNLMIRKAGLNWTLLVAPLVVLPGCLLYRIDPIVPVLAFVQIALRSIEFSLAKPSREVFYTMVDAESRYKAKNFIDTAVSRANDSASAWLVSGVQFLRLTPMVVLGLPIIGIWIWLARRIGKPARPANSTSTDLAIQHD